MYTLLLLGMMAGADPKLDDAGWLAGTWANDPAEKLKYDERWTPASHGSMMGTFKMVSGEKVSLYEFQLIEQMPDGVWLRLRHYGPNMVDRDDKPVRLKLTEATDKRLVFSNPDNAKPKQITYERDGDKLKATVETTRDDKTAKFVLRFVKG
ncbi:MAG: hypothetical protein K1X57_19580 [Gemmataceae bacterium]|nr:hypothetical protein [Gemmataceae bacterium]